MKVAFDGLIRLDTAEEGTSERKDISTESLKTQKQREKAEKNRTKHLRPVGLEGVT